MYFAVHHWILSLPRLASTVVWLVCNLTLALIPVWIARRLRAGVDRDLSIRGRVRWSVWVPVALLWLLFLPNTAYLLTEWRHYLTTVCDDPAYFPVIHGISYPADATRNLVFLTAFFGLYSLSGLVTLVKSMQPVDALLVRYAPRVRTWSMPALFLLCSVGVYLGLVDRLNSWDMLNARTFWAIVDAPARIAASPSLAILIFSFAAFLWLVYLTAIRLSGASAGASV